MIRMSKQADYGIVLLSRFASGSLGTIYSARELAGETHIPWPMASKILKLLTRQGLLISHRGATGGYRLARRPEKISVAEIIRRMEGPIALTECVEAPGDCKQEPVCQVRSKLDQDQSGGTRSPGERVALGHGGSVAG